MVLAVEGVQSFDYHCSGHLREHKPMKQSKNPFHRGEILTDAILDVTEALGTSAKL